MTIDDGNPRLGSQGGMRASPPGPLTKLLGVVIGAVVVVASLLFSVVVFAVVLAVGVIAGGYLWWRTRELRRQIRAQMEAQMQAQRDAASRARPDGRRAWPSDGGGAKREDVVIDGDYIREAPADDSESPRDGDKLRR